MPLILPGLLIGGLVFFAAVFLIALAHTFSASVGSSTQTGNAGGILGLLSAVVRVAQNPVTGFVGIVKAGVEHAARMTISRWALAHVKPLARWFHSLRLLAAHTYDELHDLSADTRAAIEHLVHVVIPREIAASRAGTLRAIAATRTTATHALARARAAEAAVAAFKTATLARMHALTHAIEVAIPREFDRVRARERAIERRIPIDLGGRLGRLEKAIAGGAIVGLLIRTLARRFPWLFCRQVGTVGRTVCGMDSDLLQSLLGDVLLIGGAVSLVEFIRDAQAIEHEALAALGGFIEEFPRM